MASSSLVPESTMQEAPTYEIKGRTMSLEEWELNILWTSNLLHTMAATSEDSMRLRTSLTTLTC